MRSLAVLVLAAIAWLGVVKLLLWALDHMPWLAVSLFVMLALGCIVIVRAALHRDPSYRKDRNG